MLRSVNLTSQVLFSCFLQNYRLILNSKRLKESPNSCLAKDMYIIKAAFDDIQLGKVETCAHQLHINFSLFQCPLTEEEDITRIVSQYTIKLTQRIKIK